MKKFSQITEKDDFSSVTHHTGKPGYDSEKHPFVVHKGREYSRTGKSGKNIASGEDSYEYSHHDPKHGEYRLWMTKSGKHHED